MESMIMVHDIAVRIAGGDFGGEEADFDKVCSAIETAAQRRLDKTAIEASIWDDEADDYVNRSNSRLQDLADIICEDTLRSLGWAKPYAPFVMVYGLA